VALHRSRRAKIPETSGMTRKLNPSRHAKPYLLTLLFKARRLFRRMNKNSNLVLTAPKH